MRRAGFINRNLPRRLLVTLVLGATISRCATAQSSPITIETSPKHEPVSPLDSARRLLDQGRYATAESALRSYLAIHEDSADALFLLAYSLFRQNKPKESINEYTRASRIRTPSADDLRYVALDYVLLNDYPDADKWMSQSLAWNDKNFETWYDLGRIRLTENRFQDAATCFSKALTLTPRSVKAENNLGLAYEGLNRIDDAIAAYRAAITWQQGSDHPSEQPLLNLATVLISRDRLDEAMPLLTQARTIAPRDPKIYEQLGRLYFNNKQLSEAQVQLEEAVKLSPDNSALHFQLGRVYQREGDEPKAKTEFARAAELNSSHSTPANN